MKMQMQHKLSVAERERERKKRVGKKEREGERVWAPCAVSLQPAFYLVSIVSGSYFSDWPHVLPCPYRVLDVFWRAGSLKCAAILRKWKITQPREQSTQRKQDGEPKKNKANWELKLVDYGIHCQMERDFADIALKKFCSYKERFSIKTDK